MFLRQKQTFDEHDAVRFEFLKTVTIKIDVFVM